MGMLSGKTREKLTDQVRMATEKVTSNILAVLGIAILAIAVASGALLVSMRALKSVRT